MTRQMEEYTVMVSVHALAQSQQDANATVQASFERTSAFADGTEVIAWQFDRERNEDTRLVFVGFHWSDKFGPCYDCGRPAAYTLDGTSEGLRCSLCAAVAAADGERITHLFAE